MLISTSKPKSWKIIKNIIFGTDFRITFEVKKNTPEVVYMSDDLFCDC